MFSPGQTQQITDPDSGKVWTLSRLEIRHVRQIQEWVRKREGDPFALVERWQGKIPESELLLLFKEAKEVNDQLRCFSLACPLAKKHLGTEEGLGEFFRVLLEGAHKGVTADEAFQVSLLRPLGEVIRTAEGTPAKNADAPPAPEAAA